MEQYTLIIQGRIHPKKRPDTDELTVFFSATSKTQREAGKKAGKTRYVTRDCYCDGMAWSVFWSKKNKAKAGLMTTVERERYMDTMLESGRTVIVKGYTLPELEGKKPGMLVTSIEVVPPQRYEKQEEYLHPKFGFADMEFEF